MKAVGGAARGAILDVIFEVAKEGGEAGVIPLGFDRFLQSLVLGLEARKASASMAQRSMPVTWSCVLTESRKPASFGQASIWSFICG